VMLAVVAGFGGRRSHYFSLSWVDHGGRKPYYISR
jgi:hypothetical protein